MATHRLNKQQQEAVDEFQTNLLVTAGAGTGKTSVLTSKFLRLLEERRAEVGEIVAITFTNKAAAEMRERIRQAIHNCYLKSSTEANAASTGESEFWKRQLLKTDSARICTFHSFCLGLIKEHPLQLGIPPVNGIFDEGEESIYLNQAVETVITEYLNINAQAEWEPRKKVLLSILLDFGWNSFQNSMGAIYQTIRESGIPISQAIDSSVANLETMTRKTPYELSHLINEIEEFLEYAARQTVSLTERAGEIVSNLRHNWQEYKISLNSNQIQPQVLPCLMELAGALPKTVPNAIKDRVIAIRDMIDVITQKLLDTESLIRLPVIGELLLKIDARYSTLKKELGALDFTDQLILARDLLYQNPELAAQIRQGIRYLLVDEFQDTNGLQMDLVNLLVGDTYQGGRFMAVGDIKQSIYRFRGADAELILQLEKRLGVEEGKVIPLTQNYRSQKLIIQFVNRISENLFKNEPFSYDALEAASQDQNAQIEFLLTGIVDTRERGVIEAKMVAQRILEMVSGSASVEGGDPISYGDIVLLFRAKTAMPIYQQALRELQIPYYVAGLGGFYHCQEVVDQLNLLRVVGQRYDGVALLGLLTSPFVGLTDESLLWLGQGKDLVEQFYQNDTLKMPSQITQAERERLSRFRELLLYLQERREFLNIPDIIRAALDYGHYRELLWAMPNAGQRLANLEKLLAKADEFVAKGFHDLRHFLMYIEKLEGVEVLEGEAPTEAEAGNTVRLMTIHGSKGLEFPVVFLPDLDRQFPRNVHGKIAYHKTVGLGLTVPYGDGETGYSSTWREIKELNKKESIQELKRLLYVALTRAKRYLIMTGSGCNKSKAQELEAADNWMKWLEILLPLNQKDSFFEYEGIPIRIIRELPPVSKPEHRLSILEEFNPELLHKESYLYTETEKGAITYMPMSDYQGLTGYEEVAATFAAPRHNALVNLKVSEILAFKNCGRRYFWRYKARLDESFPKLAGTGSGETGDHVGTRLGSFLHQAIQTSSLFSPVSGGSENDPAWFRGLMEKAFPDLSGPEGQQFRNDLEKIWGNFRKSPFTGNAGECWDEAPFQIKLPGEGETRVTVEGRFDRLLKDASGELTLVDFKTHRASAAKVTKIAEGYFWQLQIYALAVEALWGMLPNRAVLYFPYSDQIVNVPLSKALLEQTVAEVKEMAVFVGAHNQPWEYSARASESEHEECLGCGYYGLCYKVTV